MYIKKHDSWILSKKELDKNEPKQRYRKGEVRWSAVGVNIGSEIDGKGDQFLRPVLILEKMTADLYFVIPMSTKIKDSPGYKKIIIRNREVSLCLHQARTISEKRIFSRMEKIHDTKLEEIRQDFKKYLNL